MSKSIATWIQKTFIERDLVICYENRLTLGEVRCRTNVEGRSGEYLRISVGYLEVTWIMIIIPKKIMHMILYK